VVIAGFSLSLASWLLLRQSLDLLMLHEIDERVDDLESFLSARSSVLDLREMRSELMQEYQQKDEGKWLQILDEHGRWLYYSARGATADPIPPLPPEPGQAIPFQAQKGHSIRVFSRQIHVQRHSYLVSTAMSADRSVRILAAFRFDLWLLVPVVVVGAVLIGHLLSRKALSPVAVIVAEARRINDRNLSIRVPAIHSRDELSELSDTLNQMLERLEGAFRSVRLLTANASHELRTPLSLIRTQVEIALCIPRTAEHYRAILESVQDETVRMTALVENLLTLARAESGTSQLELEPVLMSELVAQMVQQWQPTAKRLALDLTLTGNSQDVWILGHQESLQRLVRILLDNACRYTPSGGRIALHIGQDDSVVTLSICDSGVGIAEKDLPHIFDRFYRAQNPLHQEPSGSGLGLSLAKWISEQHKASITVDTTPGVGSCFRVSYPAMSTTTSSTSIA
jgi:heavy metal sensor kinase